ncbi:hypothetical protein [Spiroplasma sp. BIUS-1]|uniref:hypothetical protein n=1 Tax=Spiroplasma sp. BIUS-1 TaxID=216964 RepID=UPI001397142E|nr:hypothetical protein [Spiroplasma sp. BIUS-1]QHX36925.1 hypothetical protein SBIUS_v1c06720 [Spiroplasma sp. BIUS-1]
MLKILKLLLLTSGVGTSSVLSLESKIVEVIGSQDSIQNNEVIKEPFYVIDAPSLRDENVTVDRYPNSLVYKTKVEQFISIKDLQLDHMTDYWFDSSLELSFTNIIERDSNGNSISTFASNPNMSNETFDFKVSLDKRQKEKTIEKEYSYHDKWNDTFIYTKLNLKFEKIYTEKSEGLLITGIVVEEILKDSKMFFDNNTQQYIGKITKGGMVLKEVKTKFSSRKNAFKDKEEIFYTHNTKSNRNYSYSRRDLEVKLIYDEEFYKFLNIQKNIYHSVNLKTVYSKDLFDNKDYVGTVDVFERDKVIVKNLKVVFKNENVNEDNDSIYLNYESKSKNLALNHDKIKYYISKNYKIKEEEIFFDNDDLENSNSIKKFNSEKSAVFKYTYEKPKGGILTFYVSVQHSIKKLDGYINFSNWSDIKFVSTEKNYILDNFKITSESKPVGEELKFKDFKVSNESLTLKNNNVSELFIINAEEFRKIKIKSSNNLEVNFEKNNILKIRANAFGSGFIELDSIDAKSKKIINVFVDREEGYYELEKNNLEISRGEVGEIEINSSYLDQIILINRDKNLNAKIVENKIKVKSSSVGSYEIEVMSNITKHSEKIFIEVTENASSINLEKSVSIIQKQTTQEVKINNFEQMDPSEITLETSSNDLIATIIDNKIIYFAKTNGDFEITVKYKNEESRIKIKVFDEIQEKKLDYENKKIAFEKDSFEIIHLDENTLIEQEDDMLVFSLKPNSNKCYFEVINEKGEKLKITINKEKDIEKEQTENKEDKKTSKKLALVLIPITFGISIALFFILKSVYKKSENKNKSLN